MFISGRKDKQNGASIQGNATPAIKENKLAFPPHAASHFQARALAPEAALAAKAFTFHMCLSPEQRGPLRLQDLTCRRTVLSPSASYPFSWISALRPRRGARRGGRGGPGTKACVIRASRDVRWGFDLLT